MSPLQLAMLGGSMIGAGLAGVGLGHGVGPLVPGLFCTAFALFNAYRAPKPDSQHN